jgi:C-terminal processing protease CtpA/Prc
MRLFFTIILLASISFVLSCDKQDENEYEEVNTWIRESMEENYLWNERVPSNVDGSIPPAAFFGSMLDPDDFYSYIVDDIQIVDNDTETNLYTSGLSPAFGRFSNSLGVFIVTEYVHPNSPADTAGLKRGDIILEVDGIPLTVSNAIDLFYGEKTEITYSLGTYDANNNVINVSGESVTVPQGDFEFNPVVYKDVIEEGTNKIGYLFYSDFLSGENDKYNDSVDIALQEMVAEGITDLIIDLRYNEGGDVNAAENLANALVPPAVAQNEEVLVRFRYNDIIEQRIIDEQGAESDSLLIRFSTDPDNLGLQNIYFLTTSQTSRTSELLINGLIPHMNVKTIGEATSGEFFGSTVINGNSATPPNSFLIVPVNLQYENSEGETNLAFGIQPEIQVVDELFDSFPIGDTEDPALSAAIGSITGAQKVFRNGSKAYQLIPDYKAQTKGSILFRSQKKN